MVTAKQITLPVKEATKEEKKSKWVYFAAAWDTVGKSTQKPFINACAEKGFEIIVRDTQNGIEYPVSGKEFFKIFKNDRKTEGTKQPDYRMCISLGE
jgi:hypothetical protein